MTKKILLQFDAGQHPSSFDSIVAVDAGVDYLLRYGDAQVTTVPGLVHGAMFTRGGDDLASTAIFVGGENVEDAEKLVKAIEAVFFGPIRVSVMMDANGCNTTASAAVVAAGRHTDLSRSKAVVLGGTGPVGRRVAQLLAGEGAAVTLTSRSMDRAKRVCDVITGKGLPGTLQPAAPRHEKQMAELVRGHDCVIASGAAGVQLIEESTIASLATLKVAIDLNAVPPAGIGGIEMTDKAKSLPHGVGYGAIGVGGLKMKTHKAAIRQLFQANDQVFDALEIYQIAKSIG